MQRQPGGDVRFVVHIGYDNLVPLAERLSDRQTHQTNERSGVHAKRDFAGIACVHQISHTLPCAQNRRVDFATLGVASPSLHVALEEMMIHRVQHHLRNLRTGCVVEKDESRRASQGRESSAKGFNGKVLHSIRTRFGIENTLGLWLQVLAPGYI